MRELSEVAETLRYCFSSDLDFLPQVVSGEHVKPNVQLVDVTLREGEQASSAALSVQDRVEIAKAIDRIGIKLIQGGHAIEDKDALQAYREFGVKAKIEAMVLGFMPNWKEQIDAVFEANVDCIELVFRTSDDHLRILGMTREDMMERVKQVMWYAGSSGNKPITCLLSFASKAEYGYLKELYSRGIEAGASTIGYSDSTGILKPSAVKYVVSDLKRAFDIPLRLHCHNDFGLGTANTLSAIEAGADIVDVSVNGLGERGGHASLDEVVMALRCLYGLDLGIVTSELCHLAKTVERLTRLEIPRYKPIVGRDTFAQKLDAHVLATSQVAQSIEPFDPHVVGNERRLVIGRYTGRYGVTAKAKQLGISIPETRMKSIIKKINDEAIKLKKELDDGEFRKIVQDSAK